MKKKEDVKKFVMIYLEAMYTCQLMLFCLNRQKEANLLAIKQC